LPNMVGDPLSGHESDPKGARDGWRMSFFRCHRMRDGTGEGRIESLEPQDWVGRGGWFAPPGPGVEPRVTGPRGITRQPRKGDGVVSPLTESPAAQADTINLRDYLQVLRQRKWLIAAAALVVAALALGLSAQMTPIYKSSAEVLVKPVTANAQVSGVPASASVDITTEQKIATSSAVAVLAATKMK